MNTPGDNSIALGSDVRVALLAYLERETKVFDGADLAPLATGNIASSLLVSRSLASQYLNEFVRDGRVVKVGGRPVYYLHRATLERRLHVGIGASSFSSMAELLQMCDVQVSQDFDRAIGHDMSLAAVAEQLRAAIKYPPNGLPVLLSGEVGVGKTFMARLMHEYGRNQDILPKSSAFVRVNCSNINTDEKAAQTSDEQLYLNAIARAAGGIVLFEDIELLPRAMQERFVFTALHLDRVSTETCRFVFSTSLAADDPRIASVARQLPVVVTIPALRERTLVEREELVTHLLRREGERMAANISISRGAFRRLVECDYEGNISELESCVTTCCAAAFLNAQDDEIQIKTYQLPSAIMEGSHVEPLDGDEAMFNVFEGIDLQGDAFMVNMLNGLLDAYRAYRAGGLASQALLDAMVKGVRDYEDHLAFEHGLSSAKAKAFEQTILGIVARTNELHGVDLPRKTSYLLAQELCVQLWPGRTLASWKEENALELQGLTSVLEISSRVNQSIAAHILAGVEQILGIQADGLTRLLLLANVAAESASIKERQSLGIVLSHGYSTASSIADAANRFLHCRVFEAIDMPYNQQVKDIVGPLQALVDKFSYCSGIVLLVDMGSLEEIHKDIAGLSSVTIGIINNISTGLAVEVGAGLIAGRSISDVLESAASTCQCRYTVLEAAEREEALLFCSEDGVDAADRIRQLVSQSLPHDIDVKFVTRQVHQLITNGADDASIHDYAVSAVVGTVDPQLPGVPFIALEDIISGERDELIDAVFGRYFSAEDLAVFHVDLLKNMTLQNVISSITILNPEMIFREIERATDRLQRLTGEMIAGRVAIGLYLHLCCLVERLVTRNPIEDYVGSEAFEAEHVGFVDAFRRSFEEITNRYNVDVPMSEIAYVYDYIHADRAPFRKQRLSNLMLSDE